MIVISQILLFMVCLSLAGLPAHAAQLDIQVEELVAAIRSAVDQFQQPLAKPKGKILWMEAEISYILKKEGEVGVKLYVVTADGKYGTETVQRLKLRIEPLGTPWRVEAPGVIKDATVAGVDPSINKVFLDFESTTIPMDISKDTKILDTEGKNKTIGDLRSGSAAIVTYSLGKSGEPKADTILILKQRSKEIMER